MLVPGCMFSQRSVMLLGIPLEIVLEFSLSGIMHSLETFFSARRSICDVRVSHEDEMIMTCDLHVV